MDALGQPLLEITPAEIVPYRIDIQSKFVCDALRTAAGQFILDTTQLINVITISVNFMLD